jgi:hypothetical protein
VSLNLKAGLFGHKTRAHWLIEDQRPLRVANLSTRAQFIQRAFTQECAWLGLSLDTCLLSRRRQHNLALNPCLWLVLFKMYVHRHADTSVAQAVAGGSFVGAGWLLGQLLGQVACCVGFLWWWFGRLAVGSSATFLQKILVLFSSFFFFMPQYLYWQLVFSRFACLCAAWTGWLGSCIQNYPGVQLYL